MFCQLMHLQVAMISYRNVTIITIILYSFMLFLHMISGITGISCLKNTFITENFFPSCLCLICVFRSLFKPVLYSQWEQGYLTPSCFPWVCFCTSPLRHKLFTTHHTFKKSMKERRQFRCQVFRIYRLGTTFEALDLKEEMKEKNHMDQRKLNWAKSDQYPRRKLASKFAQSLNKFSKPKGDTEFVN